jgi:hypothetical protein
MLRLPVRDATSGFRLFSRRCLLALPWDAMQELLHELLIAMGRFNVREARGIVLRAVQEYKPSGDVVDSVWCRRESQQRLQAKVTNLQIRRFAGRRESEAGAE